MLTYLNEKLDPAGNLFKLFIPAGAAGANKVYFDLFNGNDNKIIEIASITPVVSGAVAVAGTLAVDLFLTRTTDVGTGGTAATAEGTALNAATFSRLDNGSYPLPSGISARLAPGGGATAGAVLAFNSHFTEETSIASYLRFNLVEASPDSSNGKVTIRSGSGIRVVQGAVASVGNIGFDVLFSVRDV